MNQHLPPDIKAGSDQSVPSDIRISSNQVQARYSILTVNRPFKILTGWVYPPPKMKPTGILRWKNTFREIMMWS